MSAPGEAVGRGGGGSEERERGGGGRRQGERDW